MRRGEYARKTGETDVTVRLNLDGAGGREIRTGVGFFDHMLELFAFHARFDAEIACAGDLRVDAHHTVEDTGIALGIAFRQALGGGAGIRRYGDCLLPMDESLVLAAADVSGRGVLRYDIVTPAQKVGDFDCELIREFFAAFCRASGVTLHLRALAGENSHHMLEAAFKAFARALREAVSADGEDLPSTKGVLL